MSTNPTKEEIFELAKKYIFGSHECFDTFLYENLKLLKHHHLLENQKLDCDLFRSFIRNSCL